MDFLTHLLIPYLLGKVLKRDDKEVAALVLGGIAPDLDFFILPIDYIYPTSFLIMHRGITHSLFFGILTGLALLYIASRSGISSKMERFVGLKPALTGRTIPFLCAGLIIHLALDCVTTRGAPLLYPLDATRWSAELFFYTELPLLLFNLAILAYLVKRPRKPPYPKMLAALLLVLVLCGGVRAWEKNCAEDNFSEAKTIPTPNLFQWSVLTENQDGITVYSYDGISRTMEPKGTFPWLEASPGEGLDEAFCAAEKLPQVKMFSWRSYAVARKANFSEGGWDLEYIDPLMKVRMDETPAMGRHFKRLVAINVRVEGKRASIS
jgi:inner membrane protein